MKTIGAIESFTGGLFASEIVKQKGASKYFRGSLVLYASDLKQKLGINIKDGVMNKTAALDLARQGKDFLGVDICVAFTGNAGPTAEEGLKPGDVFIAINEKVYALSLQGSRNVVREKAVLFAFNELEKILGDEWKKNRNK